MAAEDNEQNELIRIRKNNLRSLEEEGFEPFDEVKSEITHKAEQINESFSELEGSQVALAGRIMAVRQHGKACFMDLKDASGQIQLFYSLKNIGDKTYEIITEKIDIGDFLNVRGEVFKTRRGEISVNVEEVKPIGKSLRPLPEKWHGLKDVDLRYRQRYIDLLVNPEVKERFVKRSQIINRIRTFLDQRDFVEVETPVLTPVAGGANARPFITHHNTLDTDFYLKIAHELYLKRLVVGGFEKVYEIGKIFRNEGISTRHNPEFTMIELYEAYADYEDMIELTEQMVADIADNVLGSKEVEYEGNIIDLNPPWDRLSMVEAVKKHTGLDFSNINSVDEAYREAEKMGLEPDENLKKGHILNLVFEEKVESNLIQPTIIYDYPVEISPLAKRKKDDRRFTYRFELFMGAEEIANAFSELNDPRDQKERFKKQIEEREAGNEEAHMMDEDFIRALEYGLPPTGGLGIGIDRLVMVLTGSPSIREVIFFPQMRSESE